MPHVRTDVHEQDEAQQAQADVPRERMSRYCIDHSFVRDDRYSKVCLKCGYRRNYIRE